MKKSKFWLIFSLVALCLVLIFLGIISYASFQKQVAKYYYAQAEDALYEFDNERSTESLLKAIKWDPEPNSPEYADFQKARAEFLEDEENKKKYLGEKDGR